MKGHWQAHITAMVAGGGVFIGTPGKQILVDEDIANDLRIYYPSIEVKISGSGNYPAFATIEPEIGETEVQATRVIMAFILRREGKDLPPDHDVWFVDPERRRDLRKPNLELKKQRSKSPKATLKVNKDLERRGEALCRGLDPDEYLARLHAAYVASQKGSAK